MKFTIDATVFQKALDTVSRASQPKVSNNAYAGIFLAAYDNQLEVQATDYQISIRVVVPAEVHEKGEVVVLAAYLPELVKRLPSDSVSVEKNEKENILKIISGHSENQVIIGMANEFPQSETVDETNSLTIPSDQIKDMYHLTQFAAAGDNQRPIFNGILLEAEEERARMVATDTHRLACREVTLAEKNNKAAKILIPEKVMAEVVRLLPTEDIVPVTIHWHRSKVAFSFANVYFISSLIDGEFPDYNRVFPPTFNAKAILDRKQFTASLERAALIARNMTYRTVNLKWSENMLELSVISAEVGSIEDRIACEYTGDPLEIVFNCFYLLDILKHSVGEKIILHILQNGPMLVEQENDELYRYVVTPMRGH